MSEFTSPNLVMRPALTLTPTARNSMTRPLEYYTQCGRADHLGCDIWQYSPSQFLLSSIQEEAAYIVHISELGLIFFSLRSQPQNFVLWIKSIPIYNIMMLIMMVNYKNVISVLVSFLSVIGVE